MQSLEEIRAHVIALKRKRVRMTGHRAMLARCLDEIDALAAALAEARRALEDVEGKLLYCPPRKCLPCVAGLACEGAPTCDSRERNHAEALAIVRAALAAEPDGTR